MITTPIKTSPVIPGNTIHSILDSYVPALREKSIVVITSKIISICEGSIVKNDGSVDKQKLIRDQSSSILEDSQNQSYGITLTITDHILIASAGIDESNGNGFMILWPKNAHHSASEIWQYLKARDHLTHLGVIITDSHTTPLRWGTTGIGIAWCGFQALKNYINTPDIFGRNLHVTKSSILDGLSASAVVVMGEGNEQTPLALIHDVPFVEFQDTPPSDQEITALQISLQEDIFAPLIDSPKWQKGGKA